MEQALAASSKRSRNKLEDDESARLDPKRFKEGTAGSATKPPYLIVHSVSCEGDSYHSHHRQHALYLDLPRLFTKDSKADGLRGTNRIEDLEQFLQDNPGYGFVVEKHYSCEAYYKDREKQFQEIGDSKLRSRISSEERAYLYTLSGNLPTAKPEDESITHFSPAMAEALNALDDLCQWDGIFDTDYLDDLKLKPPYLNIYHSRTALNDYQEVDVNPDYSLRIEGFRDYVLEAMSNDYAEADAYFKRNETTPRHLAKLFRKGDIVVTQRHGEETGLLCVSVSCPQPRVCVLECESWAFDGSFRKRAETLRVTWPAYSSVDAISIISLEAYPLRFGGTDLKHRLRKRGQKLWDCRFSKYVSYEDPSSISEIQTVSSLPKATQTLC